MNEKSTEELKQLREALMQDTIKARTTPTREQVIEWAKAVDPDSFFYDDEDFLVSLCTLAMSAGRDQGLREAKGGGR